MTGAQALAVLCLIGLGAPAVQAAEQDDRQHAVSIMLSPIHLLSPIVQVTGEFRMADKLGLAAIIGGGAVTEDDKFYAVGEIGGQVRYYLLGTFIHGMTVGVEAAYLEDGGKLKSPMGAYAGLRGGAFLGYKLATNRGFTLDLGLGNQYVYTVSKPAESCWQPIMNLKLGWSF